MCCNGWRRSWSYVSIDGRLTAIASWRPATLADPRFPWESVPSVIPYQLEQLAPRRCPCGEMTANDCAGECGKFDRLRHWSSADSVRAIDWSMEQRLDRLRGNLTLADAYVAAGRLQGGLS